MSWWLLIPCAVIASVLIVIGEEVLREREVEYRRHFYE